MFEYQVAALMTGSYFGRGCERNAYPPIVGSGPNSVVLHYMTNHRRMDAGEVVVMDVGAECSDYATDITRTIPTNGKFSERQQYWIAYAQSWCAKVTPEALRSQMTSDPHPPSEFRVNAVVMNRPEFARDFNCSPGARMAPQNRCSLW